MVHRPIHAPLPKLQSLYSFHEEHQKLLHGCFPVPEILTSLHISSQDRIATALDDLKQELENPKPANPSSTKVNPPMMPSNSFFPSSHTPNPTLTNLQGWSLIYFQGCPQARSRPRWDRFSPFSRTSMEFFVQLFLIRQASACQRQLSVSIYYPCFSTRTWPFSFLTKISF